MKEVIMKTTSAGPNGTYLSGAVVPVDDKEAEQLVNGGYAEYVDPVEEPKQETSDQKEESSITVDDYHTGGGYYELPNGEKVRGKENALEALKELEKAGDK
jgi:hypothetical protein